MVKLTRKPSFSPSVFVFSLRDILIFNSSTSP
jgi:hypothetical protein